LLPHICSPPRFFNLDFFLICLRLAAKFAFEESFGGVMLPTLYSSKFFFGGIYFTLARKVGFRYTRESIQLVEGFKFFLTFTLFSGCPFKQRSFFFVNLRPFVTLRCGLFPFRRASLFYYSPFLNLKWALNPFLGKEFSRLASLLISYDYSLSLTLILVF